MNLRQRRRSFTLIELLIVVSIIAILMSLALPAANKATQTAKKTRASSVMSQITVGMMAFNTEYSIWPNNGTVPSSDQIISNTVAYHALIGDSTGTNYGNIKQIPYVSFSSVDVNTNSPGTIVDPWDKSGTNQDYHIWLDYNYDNQITVTDYTNSPTISGGVAIWDPGVPISSTVANTNAATMIRSW